MNYRTIPSFDFDIKKIHNDIENLDKSYNKETLCTIFSLIDLTSLNTEDTETKIMDMCAKVNAFKTKYPTLPNVAAICVYPELVKTARKNLVAKDVKIASVAGGFPSAQTFNYIKILESKLAVEAGANEIDIVLSVGKLFESKYELIVEEISQIKEAIKNAHLKVILESGTLKNAEQIWNASFLSMLAGADFIKTSTGKQQPAATPEAVYIMALAIKEYFKLTGKKIGIKPAGGISNVETALVYFNIIKKILGNEWLNSELFRIGASSLANNLLNEIEKISTGEKKSPNCF